MITQDELDRARCRRRFRLSIAPFLTDQELADEMRALGGYIRELLYGSKSVYRVPELAARLRACRHEAIIVRGWDAHDDPRIEWADHARVFTRNFRSHGDMLAAQAADQADGFKTGMWFAYQGISSYTVTIPVTRACDKRNGEIWT